MRIPIEVHVVEIAPLGHAVSKHCLKPGSLVRTCLRPSKSIRNLWGRAGGGYRALGLGFREGTWTVRGT